MKIIFLGSPEFAVICLDRLIKSNHTVVAVVTQPDKPTGRGKKLAPTKVKEFAIKNGLKVLSYEKISRDGVDELRSLAPDILVTAAYGQILSKQVLEIARFGTINVHPSLLPKYRGSSPIQSAIIKGETVTGVTIMRTEIGLDDGDIICQTKAEILPDETAGELSMRLAKIGAELLIEAIDSIENGTATFTKQIATDATYTTKIDKADCVINWNKSAQQISNLVRGCNPEPIAGTSLNGTPIKIYTATEATGDKYQQFWNSWGKLQDISAGEILPKSSAKNGVFVRCGSGAIRLGNVQLPGGKVLPAEQLVSGRKLNVGDKFEFVIQAVD